MTQLQHAQKYWEDNTEPFPKDHYIGKKVYIHDFRQYGQAIAWLEWDEEYMEIKKIESLSLGKGASSRLLCFLKTISDKYHVRLFGNAIVYRPDPPFPEGELLTQEQLESWYIRHGFVHRKIANTGVTAIWYPDFPLDRKKDA